MADLSRCSLLARAGDRNLSNGRRIRLRLAMLKEYAFFPGQMLVAKGLNQTGSAIVAYDVIKVRVQVSAWRLLPGVCFLVAHFSFCTCSVVLVRVRSRRFCRTTRSS